MLRYNSLCFVTTASVLLQQPVSCYNSLCPVTTACVLLQQPQLCCVTATNLCFAVLCYSDQPVFCCVVLQRPTCVLLCCVTATNLCFAVLCYSDQPVFCGAPCLHPGGAGRGDAAPDGAESTAHPPHAHRAPVTRHVPPPHRLRHEHHAATHHQTGGSGEVSLQRGSTVLSLGTEQFRRAVLSLCTKEGCVKSLYQEVGLC